MAWRPAVARADALLGVRRADRAHRLGDGHRLGGAQGGGVELAGERGGDVVLDVPQRSHDADRADPQQRRGEPAVVAEHPFVGADLAGVQEDERAVVELPGLERGGGQELRRRPTGRALGEQHDALLVALAVVLPVQRDVQHVPGGLAAEQVDDRPDLRLTGVAGGSNSLATSAASCTALSRRPQPETPV